MKYVDTVESSNVLVSIVMDLLYFIMIGNKKQGVGSKSKLGPFWTHDVFESNLEIPIKTRHPHFLNFEEVACEWKWFELYTIVVFRGN
jgi:hypothetical protein